MSMSLQCIVKKKKKATRIKLHFERKKHNSVTFFVSLTVFYFDNEQAAMSQKYVVSVCVRGAGSIWSYQRYNIGYSLQI